MDIDIGKYDRLVILMEPTATTDNNSGAVQSNYTPNITLWCFLNDKMNNVQYLQNKRNDVRRITIDVQYNECPETINTQWQMVFEGTTYQIIESFEAPEYGRGVVRRLRGESK